MFHSVAEMLAHTQHHFWSLGPQATAMEAADIMATRHIGAVAVVEDQHLLGIFTERDLLCRVVVKGLDPTQIPLAQVMSPEPITIAASDCLVTALKTMSFRNVRHLPVVDGEQAVGMLAMRDIPTEARVLWSHWSEARHLNAHPSVGVAD